MKTSLFLFAFALSLLSHSAGADEFPTYREAYLQAQKQNKVLWLIVTDARLDLPHDAPLEKLIAADAVVQVSPSELSGSGKTYAEELKLTPTDTQAGVLALYGFHEPLLDNHQRKSGELKNVKTRTAAEIRDFYQSSIFRLSHDERLIMEATNRYRAQHGIGPLIVSRRMTQIARMFSQDPHACANTSQVHSVARALLMGQGYRGQATENIAQGHSDGTHAVRGWETSTVGHSKQLLGKINVNSQWIDGGFRYAGPSLSYGVSHQGFTGSSSIIYFGTTPE